MLPVYSAVSINKILQSGGRTKPWLIMAQKDSEIRPFVVKLFPAAQVDRYPVEAEVLGNILAKETFNFMVPDAALIDFPPEFIRDLSDENKIILESKDERIKFGTSLINNFYPYSSSIPKSYITKRIQLDTLFAFDNLIRNRDRTERKPNILLTKNDAILIDHELALEKLDLAIAEISNISSPLNWSYHIFYNHLKDSIKENKKLYFEEFMEYLRYMNVNVVDSYFMQLDRFGYNCRTKEIKNYLNYAKNNSGKFVKILNALIS
jgi:hypothetical protein